MTNDQDIAASKPLRADARRNRDAILQAARAVFDSEGVFASLDGIALRAGVGNATLYRNFPTREDLIAAVLDSHLEQARAEANTLIAEHSPREALAEWLAWLTWRLRICHGLPQCMAEASGEQESSMNPAVALLMQLTTDMVGRAKAAGAMLRTVEADDVFELALAISWAVDRFGDTKSAARRRVEVATAGFFT